MVGAEGFEPRPSAPKADALPGCATPRLLFDCIAGEFSAWSANSTSRLIAGA